MKKITALGLALTLNLGMALSFSPSLAHNEIFNLGAELTIVHPLAGTLKTSPKHVKSKSPTHAAQELFCANRPQHLDCQRSRQLEQELRNTIALFFERAKPKLRKNTVLYKFDPKDKELIRSYPQDLQNHKIIVTTNTIHTLGTGRRQIHRIITAMENLAKNQKKLEQESDYRNTLSRTIAVFAHLDSKKQDIALDCLRQNKTPYLVSASSPKIVCGLPLPECSRLNQPLQRYIGENVATIRKNKESFCQAK